jgi:DNA polymerase-3 subunit gamma/tau
LSKSLAKGEKDEVIIKLKSQLEVSFLERLETDITQHLRSALKNDHILLKKEVEEVQETDKLYTSSDIYEYMVKQNPKLKDLKDRLGLDFDY